MPGTMFTEVVCPHAANRGKRYTIILSIVAHAVAFAVAVVVPLVATAELPSPPKATLPYIAADVLPSPPPLAPVKAAPNPATSLVTREAAPIVAPTGIGVETGIVPVEATTQTGSVEGLVEGLAQHSAIAETAPAPMQKSEPIRVGGDVTPPTRIKGGPPEYPSMARLAKVEGIVIIEAIIGADGKVERASVIRSIPLLDQAALDAVRGWEYTPTLLNGRPTPVIMTVTVRFTLK